MKVGKFQIGRYHAIIRKSYAEAWTMKRPFPTMPI